MLNLLWSENEGQVVVVVVVEVDWFTLLSMLIKADDDEAAMGGGYGVGGCYTIYIYKVLWSMGGYFMVK